MTEHFVETTVSTPSGAHVMLRSMVPKGRARATIQINHGMAEHSARYDRFARALVKAGFAVFAHDHRGHGKTTAPDAPLGVFAKANGFDKVVDDVLAVNQHIKSRVQAPVICFGHSMGSIIALNFAMRYPKEIVGLVCWNAGVETGGLAAISRIILGAEGAIRGRNSPSGLADKLTFQTWNKVFAPNRTDYDWLSRDQTEVDKYVADPLCGFKVSTGLWLDLISGVYFGAQDAHLANIAQDLPVHLQGGAQDPCSNKGRDMVHLSERMVRAGIKDVTLNIIPDTRHESLNDVNRDQTTTAFIQWLSERFA